VKRTAKCGMCDFKVTKNGYWQLRDTMWEHIRSKHPKDYKLIIQNNESIERQLRELKKRIVTPWRFID